MKLENYEVHLPSYSIGDHIYDKIGPVCESYGKTVLLIGGRRALKAAEEKIRAYVAKTNLEIIGVERYGSDCTYETVEKLRQLPFIKKRTWSLVWAVEKHWILSNACASQTISRSLRSRPSPPTVQPVLRYPSCTTRTAHSKTKLFCTACHARIYRHGNHCQSSCTVYVGGHWRYLCQIL